MYDVQGGDGNQSESNEEVDMEEEVCIACLNYTFVLVVLCIKQYILSMSKDVYAGLLQILEKSRKL